MYQRIYGVIRSKIKITILSHLLSFICICAYCVLYFLGTIYYLFLFPQTEKLSKEQAMKIISGCYNKPQRKKAETSPKAKCNEEPELSVIIPVYNAQDSIKKCIESVTSQANDISLELILINDGSKDNSLEIMEDYEQKHSFIKLFNQENKGIAYTRNVGISQSCGAYIMFLDADDYLAPGCLKKLTNKAMSSGSDIIEGKNIIVRNGVTNTYRSRREKSDYYINLEENPDFILGLNAVPWGRIYKRSLWDNVAFLNGFDFEDTLIYFIIFRKAKSFSYIRDEVTYHFVGEKSITQRMKESTKCLDSFFIIEELLRVSSELNLPEDKVLYKMILIQCSDVLYKRTVNLNRQVKSALIVLAADLLKMHESIRPENLGWFLKRREQAIKGKNLRAWEFLCKF